MTGNSIGEEPANFFAINFDSLFGAACSMIDTPCIFGDAPLKGIRVLANIVQKPACRCRYASLEATPKSASKSTCAPKMPFQMLPRLKWFTRSAVCVEYAIDVVLHQGCSYSV